MWARSDIAVENTNFWKLLYHVNYLEYVISESQTQSIFQHHNLQDADHICTVNQDCCNINIFRVKINRNDNFVVFFYTTPFGASLFLPFRGITFHFFKTTLLAKDNWIWLNTKIAHVVHIGSLFRFKMVYIHLSIREKGGDLTQFYDKSPYTDRKIQKKVTTQKRHQKLPFWISTQYHDYSV